MLPFNATSCKVWRRPASRAKRALAAGLALALAACQGQPADSTPGPGAAVTASAPAPVAGETFTNPVLSQNFPDPGVLQVGDTFYLYATNGSGRNVQVARSTDFLNWEILPDAMPALPKWAKLTGGLTWAPEVIQIGEQFVLYYTTRDKATNRQCVGVAVSAKPEGKFRDTRDQPLVCQAPEGGTIDASPFRDGERLYLYFKNDGNCCGMATYLYGQQLAPDGLSLVGEPVRLVRNDRQWEGGVVEAPTMVERDGAYYLFYSGNNYAGHEYAIGYAVCETAVGPCEDAPENPILASQLKPPPLVVGPGHQTVVELNGETWLVYHVWEMLEGGRRGERRLVYLDRLIWEGGQPDVLGPTTDPQPAPLP